MSNWWDNDPIVEKQGGNWWDSDPVVGTSTLELEGRKPFGEALRHGFSQAGIGMVENLGGIVRSLGEFEPPQGQYYVRPYTKELNKKLTEKGKELAEYARIYQQEHPEEIARYKAVEGNFLQKYAGMAKQALTQPELFAQSLIESGPLILEGILGTTVAGPVGGITLMAGGEYGTDYERMRSADVDPQTATGIAAMTSITKAWIEQLTLSRKIGLFNLAKAGKLGPIMYGLAKDFAAGSAEEFTQKVTDNLGDILANTKEMSAENLLEGAPEAAGVGGPLEMGMGGAFRAGGATLRALAGQTSPQTPDTQVIPSVQPSKPVEGTLGGVEKTTPQKAVQVPSEVKLESEVIKNAEEIRKEAPEAGEKAGIDRGEEERLRLRDAEKAGLEAEKGEIAPAEGDSEVVAGTKTRGDWKAKLREAFGIDDGNYNVIEAEKLIDAARNRVSGGFANEMEAYLESLKKEAVARRQAPAPAEGKTQKKRPVSQMLKIEGRYAKQMEESIIVDKNGILTNVDIAKAKKAAESQKEIIRKQYKYDYPDGLSLKAEALLESDIEDIDENLEGIKKLEPYIGQSYDDALDYAYGLKTLTPAQQEGKVEKVEYTSVPKEWFGVKNLVDRGKTGLHVPKGSNALPTGEGKRTRKSFIWNDQFAKVPVRLENSQVMNDIKEMTDEVVFVKNGRKGEENYYLAPKQVIEQIKAKYGEKWRLQRPKPERSPKQKINDLILSGEVKKDLPPYVIGEAVLQSVKEFGIKISELSAKAQNYVKEYEDAKASGKISETVQSGMEQEVLFDEVKRELEAERRAIQDEDSATEIGDFLDGLIETKEKPPQKDLLGRPVLEGGASGKQKEFLDKEDYKTLQERERINAEKDIEGQKTFPEKKPKGGGKSIGFIGESGEIDTGEIKVSMEPTGKPVSARSIVDYMSRAFNIVIKGKATFTKKKALGWFDPRAIGIRMKDVVAITTGTHEIAHHIDWTLNNRMSSRPPSQAIANELMKLGKALYGNRKPPGGYKSEGWAEFVREYLTGEEAESKAPNLHKWFTETYLKNNKDIAKKLANTRAMIDKWRLQGAEARVDSQINRKDIKGTLWERIKRSLLWIETSFRDELAPIQRAMKRAGIKEGELKPDQDPYQIAVARADKAGAVAMQFVLKYTTDLAGNRTGKGLREILKPVAKDINAFTRWIVSARARLLYKKGVNPGISRKDANYVYEKYDNETWQEVLKEITAWNHRVLDYLAEAGGIEKDAVKLIKNSNPIYIPFMRAFKEGELRMEGGAGKGIAKVGKPVKKIKGSGREIIDPIESMIKQTHKIISVAHKAEIAKSLASLSSKRGIASMIWRVPAPKQATRFEAEQLKKDIARIAYERMGLDPDEISSAMLEHWDDILTVYSNAGQYYGKDNIVALVVDGKKQWFEVEPSLYRAIEGVDLYTLPWFWNVTAGKASRAVRLGATGLNPSFGLIRNFLRDAMTFTVLSEHAKAGPLSAVKGITEDIIDTESAKKFKAMGGKMSSFILADRQAMQHLRKNVLASSIAGKTLYTVAHPVDALRELFGVTEAGTRIGEFSVALEYGEKKWGKNSKSAAIYALNKAQDVTVNFSRHGKIAKSLNQVIPFFNAAIQGVDKIFRTFNQRPVETSLKAIISLTIPAVWLWWKYKDEEWYRNMPEYERVNYLHFEIPDKNVVIRIPVPFELGHIFQSAPVAALDAKYRKDPEIVNEMFKESLRQANPFDWPALIGPAVDILANRDFAGRPIVSQSVENKLPEDQYKEYTTKLMREIGKAIGYSPAKLEYIVNSYSGGLYSRVARTAEFASKDKESIPSDIPVAGTLFMREPYAPKAQIARFYNKRDELNQKYSSKKITSRENAIRKKYNKISDKMSDLWKMLGEAKTESEKKEVYKKMNQYLNYAEGISK